MNISQEIAGSQFFYMNHKPINIHVSESLTKIGKLHDASWGDAVTLYGPEGCYAQKYAEESEGKYSFVAE